VNEFGGDNSPFERAEAPWANQAIVIGRMIREREQELMSRAA
jgi:hypothetical protein